MDGLNHSEAVMVFAKLTQQALGRDKREIAITIVRQIGYERDERHTFLIPKGIGQQVGVKLYNVLGNGFDYYSCRNVNLSRCCIKSIKFAIVDK